MKGEGRDESRPSRDAQLRAKVTTTVAVVSCEPGTTGVESAASGRLVEHGHGRGAAFGDRGDLTDLLAGRRRDGLGVIAGVRNRVRKRLLVESIGVVEKRRRAVHLIRSGVDRGVDGRSGGRIRDGRRDRVGGGEALKILVVAEDRGQRYGFRLDLLRPGVLQGADHLAHLRRILSKCRLRGRSLGLDAERQACASRRRCRCAQAGDRDRPHRRVAGTGRTRALRAGHTGYRGGAEQQAGNDEHPFHGVLRVGVVAGDTTPPPLTSQGWHGREPETRA